MSKLSSSDKREFRHERVRKKVLGTAERPRLNVFRSSKHITAQIIDDVSGRTLASVSTSAKNLLDQVKKGCNRAAAREVGKVIAQKAKEKGIAAVVFDRGGYLYHGRVKELADGAREGGLKF